MQAFECGQRAIELWKRTS